DHNRDTRRTGPSGAPAVSARPLTVCHRGASALAAENSLDAFRIAMEYGIDFSELDVFVSRDGDLVVTHDPVVDAAAERTMPRLRRDLRASVFPPDRAGAGRCRAPGRVADHDAAYQRR